MLKSVGGLEVSLIHTTYIAMHKCKQFDLVYVLKLQKVTYIMKGELDLCVLWFGLLYCLLLLSNEG